MSQKSLVLPRTPGPVAPAPITSGAAMRDPNQAAGEVFLERPGQQSSPTGLGIVRQELLTQLGANCPPDQYLVRVAARTVSFEAAQGLPTATRQDILNGQRHAPHQVRLEYSDGSGLDQEVDLDVGPGFAMSMWAASVRVYLLLDSSTFVVPTPGVTASKVGPTGAVVDTWLNVSINRTSYYPTRSLWQLTDSKAIAMATQGFFAIPPRAQYVRVFQAEAEDAGGNPIPAPAPAQWHFQEQSGMDVGFLPWIPGRRMTDRVRIPGHAARIISDRVDEDDRHFSAVFEIEL